jgi:4-amino-4-deoxy-L-arabinose transferase-like glycosyltransferase
MISRLNTKSSYWLIALLFLIVVIRISMMINLPLMDTTEARYGELARVTATGHFWLMPHITVDQPFFAKPPLFTWLSASSWLAFGHNEFALRLPSILLMFSTFFALYYGAQTFKLTRFQWLLACFVIITAPLGFVSAGAVMTEASQLTVVTWAMVFLSRIFLLDSNKDTINKPLKIDQFGFWFVMGIGAVTKGLATWALICMPVALFMLMRPNNNVFLSIKKLWHIPSILIFLIIVLGWYTPAEIYYPGFLKYFIIGEHFQRFLEPSWKGDMYGNAHQEAIGMIWLYWIMSITVWTPIFVKEAFSDRPIFNRELSDEKKWLWAWLLTPLLFFTFSRNIIWTYTLTALPALSIIVSKSWPLLNLRFRKTMLITITIWLIAAFLAILIWLPNDAEGRSARMLVQEANIEYPHMTLYSYGTHKFSVSYYTNGQRKEIKDQSAFNKVLMQPNNLLIINTQLAKKVALQHQAKIIKIVGNQSLIMTISRPAL